MLRKWIPHVRQYRIGYLILVFLLVTGLTCGVRCGNGLDEEKLGGFTTALSFGGVFWLLLRETLFTAVLLLAVLHPFGCALCCLLVLGKAFLIGYGWGWWNAKFALKGFFPFLLTLLPQGILSIGAYTYGGCVSAYAALRVAPLTRQELYAMLIMVWILQMIAVLLRCLGSAWMSGIAQ